MTACRYKDRDEQRRNRDNIFSSAKFSLRYYEWSAAFLWNHDRKSTEPVQLILNITIH